jgi:prolyl oligopeptidase
MRSPIRVFGLLVTLSCAGAAPVPSAPPAAEAPSKTPSLMTRRDEALVEVLHGEPVKDPYRWLEDEKSPEVKSWMQAQDASARAFLSALPGREALRNRIKQLAYVESMGPPVQRGRRLFYMRTHADKEKAILYTREGETGVEKVLLDPNAWTKEGTDAMGVWEPSPDGRRVAFTRKPDAADEAILHIVDVATGEWSKIDVIPGAKYAEPSWTADGKQLVYAWLPSDPSIPTAERPGYTEMRLHTLGKDPSTDVMLHPRTQDPKSFLQGSLSRDGKYLFVHIVRGWAENDIYWRRFDGKPGPFQLLVKGQNARYQVVAWKDRFYLRTDEGAPRYRIFRAQASNPARSAWKELVPEDPKHSLNNYTVVGGHLALAYLKDATTELRVATLEGKPVRTVELPGLGAASLLQGQEDLDTAYFQFSSFTVPRQVYKTSVRTGTVSLWAKISLPIEPDRFTVRQEWFTSRDGTRVPMFVVHRKDLVKDGSHPTALYGYGGFNQSMTPDFRASIYPWLESGGIYVVANLRGGGEYGKDWHEAGWRGKKQNVFDDFIGAAEFLVKEGYTKPSRLVISGRSNGGLLVGAAMTQRPDLFAGVLCGVPLLDMVRYHRFGSGMTWIPEYGSADDPEGFRVLKAYSPYHRVQKAAYPALLMASADHDDRVDPLHARKFVAAVQRESTSGRPVLLRIETNAGHGGGDQVKKAVEQAADEWAFLLWATGATFSAPGSTAAR